MKENLKKLRDYLRIERTYYQYNKKISSVLASNDNVNIKLSSEEIKETIKFWSKYNVKLNLKWHKAYSAIDNKFDAKYIPEDIFYARIQKKLGNLELSKAYSDKNNYDRLFPSVEKPQTIIRNIYGNYYDKNYNYLNTEKANEILSNIEGNYVIKPTIETSQGRGVHIVKFKKGKVSLDGKYISIKQLKNTYKKDFIIQEKIDQNNLISNIYPDSLNTLRIMTIKYKNTVYILSTVLRLGNHGLKVDNFTLGGVAVGVDSDGKLNDFAVDQKFNKYSHHPFTNVSFKNIKIPKFSNAIEMVKKLHKKLFYFDLVSWDLALNDQNEYVFIEANLGGQDINLHQTNNGSLFGDFTEQVLEEVFTD